MNVIEGLAIGLERTQPVERAMDALSATVSDYAPAGALAAPTASSSARAAAPVSGTPAVVELGPATIHALARAMETDLYLDGRRLAYSASRHFAASTALGAA